MVLYKKLNFWEEYTPLPKRHSDVALTCYVKAKPSPKLNESMPVNNYVKEELKPQLPDSVTKARKDIKKKSVDHQDRHRTDATTRS